MFLVKSLVVLFVLKMIVPNYVFEPLKTTLFDNKKNYILCGTCNRKFQTKY